MISILNKFICSFCFLNKLIRDYNLVAFMLSFLEVATAEKNAAVLLTARAGARDPSAVPFICRISAALQYPAGIDGLDTGLASVLESMEFCLKLRGSEALY
ncbi:hypothetical protein ACS0TY_027173 [Phlomoides rotata]